MSQRHFPPNMTTEEAYGVRDHDGQDWCHPLVIVLLDSISPFYSEHTWLVRVVGAVLGYKP